MKRTLAVVGFTLMVSLCLLCAFDSVAVSLICAGVAYVLFMVTCFIKEFRIKLTLPTVLFTVVIACFMFYCVQSDYAKISHLSDKDSAVICEIKEKPEFSKNYGRYYCKAKIIEIDGVKYKGNIRLSFDTDYEKLDIEDFVTGNILSFKGHLYKVGGNDKGIADYFKSEGIYVGVYGIDDVSVEEPEYRPLAYYGEKLRTSIAKNFNVNFSSQTAGFLTALITGSKDYISDRVYDNFKNAGIAHIMAVSGMHLAVMAMLLNLIFKKLREKHKLIYFIIMFTFIGFIMFTAAFSSSVVRAGIMLFMILFGNLINQRGDSLNSLGLACVIILCLNPFACLGVGFQLSVVSTFSIIAFAAPFCRRKRYFLADTLGFSGRVPFAVSRAVMFCVVVSFCVLVCTFPVMAINFGEASLISPISNLLLLPVASLIIYMAFFSAALCAFGIMPDWLIPVVEKISSYCLSVAELLGGSDGFVLKVDSVVAQVICCFVPVLWYLAIKGTSYLYRKHKRKKIKPL